MKKETLIEEEKLENFEMAFGSGSSGCVRTCECGKTYYDCENHYDWEDGEFEALKVNEKAFAVSWSVGTVVIQGKEYAVDCDCWKPNAMNIISFLESHAIGIADYFKREKKRLSEIAERFPTV